MISMLDTTSRYVYEVYRCQSVSLAAEKLFLSQPALSAAVRKAEKELGAPIFNRKTLPFTLTDEGKIYIETIEKMMQLEIRAQDRIRDISQIKSGTLKIATSTHLSFYVIPRILEVFHKKYPQIDINIIVTDTDKLYDLLHKNLADLIFIPTDITDTFPQEFQSVNLLEEKFVVAVCAGHPGTEHLRDFSVSYEEIVNRSYESTKEIANMSLFRDIEFIYSQPNTNIYKKRRMLLGHSDMHTFITSSVGRQQLNYNLMQAGFGAFFTTDANIATLPPNTDCLYFVLRSTAAKQFFSIVYPKPDTRQDDSLSARIAEEFVNNAKELFQGDNPLKQFHYHSFTR